MIEKLLDELFDLRSAVDLLMSDKALALESVLTEDQRIQIRDINIEFDAKLETVNEKIAELESSIKERTLELGESVKTQHISATYISGRVTWDTKRLDGFLVAHPELVAFRKEGEPSVQIKIRK